MTKPTIAFAAAAAVAALMSSASAARAADVEHGHILAQVWCANCHAVERAETAVRDTPPSFASIAKRPEVSESSLRGWLHAPHPSMPNFDLSRASIEDLVAYIESLK